jgi:hypothetical protein
MLILSKTYAVKTLHPRFLTSHNLRYGLAKIQLPSLFPTRGFLKITALQFFILSLLHPDPGKILAAPSPLPALFSTEELTIQP